MRRRDLLGGVIAGAALTPVLARAQQKSMPVVGYLGTNHAGAVCCGFWRRFIRG